MQSPRDDDGAPLGTCFSHMIIIDMLYTFLSKASTNTVCSFPGWETNAKHALGRQAAPPASPCTLRALGRLGARFHIDRGCAFPQQQGRWLRSHHSLRYSYFAIHFFCSGLTVPRSESRSAARYLHYVTAFSCFSSGGGKEPVSGVRLATEKPRRRGLVSCLAAGDGARRAALQP